MRCIILAKLPQSASKELPNFSPLQKLMSVKLTCLVVQELFVLSRWFLERPDWGKLVGRRFVSPYFDLHVLVFSSQEKSCGQHDRPSSQHTPCNG